MLMLTRRIGEAIIIGEGANQVQVRVLGAKGNQVRLGIEAPREMPVNRQEIHERIQRGETFDRKPRNVATPVASTADAEHEAN